MQSKPWIVCLLVSPWPQVGTRPKRSHHLCCNSNMEATTQDSSGDLAIYSPPIQG